MTSTVAIPSDTAEPYEWCRWAWLIGRQCRADARAALCSIIFEDDRDITVRQTALSAYWMLSDVKDAIQLEEGLLAERRWGLALWGLDNPQWWHDARWLDASQNWIGVDQSLDSSVIRLQSWGGRKISWVRVPEQIYDRVAGMQPPLNWRALLEVGAAHLGGPKATGFPGFWAQHITDWAEKWFHWEESVWLYRWRLQEERNLVEWTQSEPYGASSPIIPGVECLALEEPRTVQDSTLLMMLGLGYDWGANASVSQAAEWDSIWSSWGASLNYALFEMLANVQVTEWHIAGLTGSLRDQSRAQHWGLQLD